jgi:hypothetical protein
VSAQLALHYERAGLLDQVAVYCYGSGKRARQVFTSHEAITSLQNQTETTAAREKFQSSPDPKTGRHQETTRSTAVIPVVRHARDL